MLTHADAPHETGERAPEIRLGSRRVPLPRSRALRIATGAGLVLGGILGFLPILGFWMLPLGMLVLAYDVPAARRLSRRIAVRWGRFRRSRSADAGDGTAPGPGGEPARHPDAGDAGTPSFGEDGAPPQSRRRP
jgi:hypothetical protein